MQQDLLKTPLTLPEIKKRIKEGFISLTARQIFIRAISFISINIILAKFLPVETLGIFNIATAIITFFSYFSDVGLAASLIQKGKDITHLDIKTTFTMQQILVGVLSLIVIIAAPVFGEFYQLNEDGVWLIRILGVVFFLTSLKVIPSILLERQLKFKPLVGVEMLEAIVFNLTLIILVINQFSIWSFSVAAFLRALVGLMAIYWLSPVKLEIGIDKISAKSLLSFGLPFQINSMLALLKDKLVPLLIARMIGTVGVGYITWVQALAFLPLELMNPIIRITFPAYSRLQEDKESLSKLVEKTLFLTAVLVYPALFGLGAILPSLVEHVVSSKWQPAISSFYLFAFSTYWAVISTTFTNTLNATGHIKSTLKLMIMWTFLTWILTPGLVFITGSFIGVAIASFLISFTSVVTIILVKRILEVKVLEAILIPTLASMIMGVTVYIYAINFVTNEITLVSAIILGILIYIGLIFIFAREKIPDIKTIKGI